MAHELERTREGKLRIGFDLKELSDIANTETTHMREVEVENYMEELVGYGLVRILRNRYDGPYYQRARLGTILLEYIQEEAL